MCFKREDGIRVTKSSGRFNSYRNRSARFRSPLGGGGVRFHQTGESHGYHQESRVAESTHLVLRRCQRLERKCYNGGIFRGTAWSTAAQGHHEGCLESR